MANNNPIGIFDSGVGGLSVLHEISSLLPDESLVYYADTANCPYGGKTQDVVVGYSEAATRFLLDRQCKIIVVACNTATSIAIAQLRKTFDLPFVGIVPALKPAAMESKTGVIAVLATAGTLNSQTFDEVRRKFSGDVEIIPVVANDLVDIVENSLQGTETAKNAVQRYIQPLLRRNIDHLVLGCTHFPFLIDDIRKFTGDRVVLDNPAPAVAQRVKFILEQNGLSADAKKQQKIDYYSSGDLNKLLNFAVQSKKMRFINS
jgi:glutamate racemase